MKKILILVLAIASLSFGWFWLSLETDYCTLQYEYFGKTKSGDADVYGKDNQFLIGVTDTNNDEVIEQELWGYPQLAGGGNFFLKDQDFDGVYDEVVVMKFAPTYVDVKIPVPSNPPFICKAHSQALKKDTDNSSVHYSTSPNHDMSKSQFIQLLDQLARNAESQKRKLSNG